MTLSELNILFVIPARGGSKGIPKKNIKLLGDKPLLHYSIEFARLFAKDENICLSTDNDEIKACAKQIGYNAPFVRPAHLATDDAGSYGVLKHALDFYEEKKRKFDIVVLLQVTSPFREKKHFIEALSIFHDKLDMVVSVKESPYNPYYNLFEEQSNGILKLSKGDGSYIRRQDIPPVYAYNGSIYIINSKSLKGRKSFAEFDSVAKYIMDEKYSLDIDSHTDWELAEIMNKTLCNG
jgi:CMP-N,N'-diacetyllegionaminic acid synthase